MKSSIASLAGRSVAAAALLLTLALAGARQDRLIAVGDVHGSLPQFANILQRTGVIDARRQWAGGSTILVQIGDVTNRGTQTRQCLDLLMQLEAQAGEQNGKVIPLLGNHEVMSIIGDLRYVLPEDFQAFAGEQSEGLRERAYEEYRAFLARSRERGRVHAAPDEAARQKWMEEHPLGFFEFRDAFGPQGLYGRWLRKLDTVAQVGDVLFVHGGLSPSFRFRSIDEINDRVRAEMARFDSIWQSLAEQGIIWRYMKLEEARRAVQEELAATGSPGGVEDPHTIGEMREFFNLPSWIMVSPDGPLWYRGYAQEPEDMLARGLDKMMSRLKVRHIVVAHTITDSRRITDRCGGRVFLIDTGMMFEQANQGRASALEIQNGQFTAHYSDGEQQVLLRREGGGTVPALGHGAGNGKQKP
jgi:diadenosine tetraphosphatase ApaH/serine/threonine PP2A family protein phosphatase